jgi:DNA polymerase (family 10)
MPTWRSVGRRVARPPRAASITGISSEIAANIVEAAARHGVALEINSQAYRLDMNDAHARLARQRGVDIVISSDSHSREAFGVLNWGVTVARRAWLQRTDVLNTLPFDEFRSRLRRNRR